MGTRNVDQSVRLPGVCAVLIILAVVNGLGHAQTQEILPPELAPAAQAATTSDSECPSLDDPPVAALTVDIRPRDAQGRLVPADKTPQSCWKMTGREAPALFMVMGGVDGDGSWACHDLLQLARFCHPPLYFEDAPLERCGAAACCPPVQSVALFGCDLVLLPAKLIVQKPRTFVRTPTPHCVSPSCLTGRSICGDAAFASSVPTVIQSSW